MNGQWWGLIGVALSVIGSVFVARLSAKAQNQKAATDADVTSGQLALAIAKEAKITADEAQDEARALNQWRRTVVNKWGPAHDNRDRIIEMHLQGLDPGFSADLPEREPMPTIPDDE